MMSIIVVQGAQYGSEGKGQVAANLCVERNVDFAIRTGAINAGHTVYYNGVPYKMQQLPTGWVNPNTKLVIGPGAYIHLPTLLAEVRMVGEATGEGVDGVKKRLLIDHRVGYHSIDDENVAKKANRHLHIGATGKGCAEAIIAKIANRGHGYLFHHTDHAKEFQLVDVPGCIIPALHNSAQLLIEGTQGSLLDLHLGPWPYVTSRMTSAANWVAEAGLSPAFKYEIVLVARTYPIRVAGNSGPLPEETSWPTLCRVMNRKRLDKGMTEIVPERALYTFEQVLAEEAVAFKLPRNLDPLKQHLWSEHDRFMQKETLSNLNADALRTMAEKFPEDYANVSKVFELTTVTKKLRRIGHLNREILRQVIMRERPSSVVVSFLNYVFPHLWGSTSLGEGNARAWLYSLQSDLGGTPIDYVTLGPLPGHMVRFR